MEIYRRIAFGKNRPLVFILVRWKNGKYYWKHLFESTPVDAPLIKLESRNKHRWALGDNRGFLYNATFIHFKESDLNGLLLCS